MWQEGYRKAEEMCCEEAVDAHQCIQSARAVDPLDHRLRTPLCSAWPGGMVREPSNDRTAWLYSKSQMRARPSRVITF